MMKKLQNYFENSKEMIIFITLVAVTVIIYIYLNYNKVIQHGYLSLDTDKPMDLFVRRLIGLDTDKDINILNYCEYNVQNIIILILKKITGSSVYALNIYYVLSFFMIAIAVYCMLRRMDINFTTALFFSVLSMILPFHTDRGQGQIISSNFFMAPILFYMLKNVYLDDDGSVEGKNFIWIAFLTPLIDIRLSYMLMVLMVIMCVAKKDNNCIKNIGVIVSPMFIESVVISILNYDNTVSVRDIVKTSSEEGLRILDIIVPVRYHVVGRLMNFRFDYDDAFRANGESGLNSIGILLSLGFIFSLAFLIFGKRNRDKFFEKWIGYIDVIVIVIAGVDGLCLLFDYAGMRVIYWNRMAIFIIIGSIVFCAKYLDIIKDRMHVKVGKNISIIFIAGIELLSILDILLRRWMFF